MRTLNFECIVKKQKQKQKRKNFRQKKGKLFLFILLFYSQYLHLLMSKNNSEFMQNKMAGLDCCLLIEGIMMLS